MPVNDPTERDSDQPTMGDQASRDKDFNAPTRSHNDKTLERGVNQDTQSSELRLPFVLGNYTLRKKVGKGGMGVVYEGVTGKDGSIVAVKILRAEIMASSSAVRRFAKEARLLAEIDSPYVTRHIEFDSIKGLCFMVSEFVQGVSLRAILRKHEKLPSDIALSVIRDVLRALKALHSKGVVHRDVKPENVIAVFEPSSTDGELLNHYKQIKLTDFGLARHVEQSESMALTQHKAILGTPLYMSPEQHAESRSVDSRADVYSVGATLYHLLSGNPPFTADDFLTLSKLHREQDPKTLSNVESSVSEAVSNVVAKAMEKQPDLRYRDAEEMLIDIERILAGKPITIRLYPATPACDDSQVRKYSFEWELAASIVDLWPLVADTDRFNRAIGLPAPEFSYESHGDERRVLAKANFNGMKVRWREHPFQWTRERSLSVLREFESGPFEWVTSTVELAPLVDDRTRVTHSFQVKPRGLMGRLLTPLQFAVLTKRSLDRVYQRMEKMTIDVSSPFACHAPLDKQVSMKPRQTERLGKLADSLAAQHGISLAERLSDFLSTVSDSAAARIRPLVLAKEVGCSGNQSLDLCMSAVSCGLLKMSWDIICPVCRIAASNVGTLEKIESHSSCEFCDREFEVDFAQTVELVFGVHPEIRDVDIGTYCIGGPFHSPHVIAQNRLLKGEQVDVGAEMRPGSYQVRGPQLDKNWKIEVRSKFDSTRAEIDLTETSTPIHQLAAGQICVCLQNRSDAELLVRLEQRSERDDAITAASVVSNPLFKKLFPDEISHSQQLVEKTTFNLLAIWDANSDATVEEIGEIKMRSNWSLIQEMFSCDTPQVCELVECSYDSIILAFEKQSELAVKLLEFYQTTPQLPEIRLADYSLAILRGELLTGNQAGQTKHFGQPLRQIKRLVDKMKSKPAVMVLHKDQLNAPDLNPIFEQLAVGSEPSPIVDEDQLFCLGINQS